MSKKPAIAKPENYIKLIGKNLSDVISDLQDSFRKRLIMVCQEGDHETHLLEDDHDIGWFFAKDERLEYAIITGVEIDWPNWTFDFKYKFAEVV